MSSTPSFSTWLVTKKRPILIVLLLAWLGVVVGSQLIMPPLLAAAFDGESSIEWLNNKIANHRAYRLGAGMDGSREWYLNWASGYALRSSALTTLATAIAVIPLTSSAARWRVRRFLFASSSPLNLAVLRISAFSMLLFLLCTEPILTYAGWSRDMYQWPLIAGMLYRYLPITVEVVAPLLIAAKISASMAIVGLFTRFTTVISVLLGIYLIGIPQLSGKVNHLHHVILIGIVLACSRCGDSFSFDAIWRAIRRADEGVVAAPRRAVRYGMPIRFAMMVMATIYFFPGFWKLATNGPAWVFSNNLENHMLQKWFELEHYTPPFPLHEMPFSGPMGSLYALVFEFGLPFALLWRPTRGLWGAMGFVFHNLTNLLMKISFFTLQMMYVMFVDWQGLFAWIGRRLFKEPIRVLYDGNCGLCRRTMAVLNLFDWLKMLKPVNALNRDDVIAEGLGHLEDAALMQDMHAAWKVTPGKGEGESSDWASAKGYDAYQQITWRVPVLWPLLPFIYLPPVVAIGWKVYRRVADSRACRVPSVPKGATAVPASWAPAWSWRPLGIICGSLLAIQCVLGAGRLHKSWPLTCYPLFDQMADRTVIWPEFTLVDAAGDSIELDDDTIRNTFGEGRYVESMRRFLKVPFSEAESKKMLTEFVTAWTADGTLSEQSRGTVQVILATYELTGPARPEEPAKETPLMQVDLDQLTKEQSVEAEVTEVSGSES